MSNSCLVWNFDKYNDKLVIGGSTCRCQHFKGMHLAEQRVPGKTPHVFMSFCRAPTICKSSGKKNRLVSWEWLAFDFAQILHDLQLWEAFEKKSCQTLWKLDLIFFFTLMSVLYNDVHMDQLTARITKVWNLCCHYQDIYDWILPFKKPDLWFIYTAVNLHSHLYIFTSLKHKLMILRCNMFRVSFLYPITDFDSM